MITGKIQKTEESTDGRKNIIIYVNFYEDGTLIVEGWKLYARFENFLGMDKEQVSEWIRINIEYQIGNLIKTRNQGSINETLMAVIDSLKDREYATDKVDIEMPTSSVIETAYMVTLAADGTLTVK